MFVKPLATATAPNSRQAILSSAERQYGLATDGTAAQSDDGPVAPQTFGGFVN
jgi:hypothetical protein